MQYVKKKMKLNLVGTNDKFERMTLGDIVDIARQGNAYSQLQDAGGLLPIGMSVQDWRHSAWAAQSTASSRVEKATAKKKRTIILEVSSDEVEDEDDKEAGRNTTAYCVRCRWYYYHIILHLQRMATMLIPMTLTAATAAHTAAASSSSVLGGIGGGQIHYRCSKCEYFRC